MLRIISGKAATGKSSYIMSEIAGRVKNCDGRSFLLVPEKYSHEAMRELCSVCGDSMSLYADVLSFTDLSRRLEAAVGGGGKPWLDKGGRLLCMALATEALHSKLTVCAGAHKKSELLTLLLSAVDELKSACISPDALIEASGKAEGTLSEKLSDLALIMEAYDAVAANGHAEPGDRLTYLVGLIEKSSIDETHHYYIDGFTDFTVQEIRVIEALLKKNAFVTLCLGCDDLVDGSEIFSLPRKTARHFLAFAKENGIGADCVEFTGSGSRKKALTVFADELFRYSTGSYDCDCIELFSASGIAAECELAAAKAIELMREKGCRRRDIAIAVRGYEDYRETLEGIFSRCGVPLYHTKKTSLLSKPLPGLIASAYEIIGGGWEADDIFSYLRTGLAGLSTDECDRLENYVLLWQLHGSAWTKNEDWKLHPGGFSKKPDDASAEALRVLNELRRRVSTPLLRFAEMTASAGTARLQAEALAELFENLSLADRLSEKADALSECGRGAEAQEYAQLWDICVSALEQCTAILGDAESDAETFGRLFTTMLSRCDVGSIPASLDSVTAGELDRMRRRRIKHLIILGASDSRIPGAPGEGGMFSDDERRRLAELDIDLGGTGEDALWREFSLIYNCITLPSESLTLCFSAAGGSGEEERPSFVMERAKKLFGLEIKPADMAELRMNCLSSVTELAAASLHGGEAAEISAAEYLLETEPERLAVLRSASEMARGKLSESSVRSLYGDRLRLSASRIDKFSSCRFSYFMQYGLRAKPRETAGFKAPEMGIFMHYILENTAKAVNERGGFAAVTDEELSLICDGFIAQYVRETLNDFRDRTARFEYLFRRLTKEVRTVVLDMAAELRVSDFRPISFELDFSKEKKIPPLIIGEDDDPLQLSGIADRVDGWVHDGRLYIRIVDYKTGRKEFSLSDVWYGMGLQMLLYLFSLSKNGAALYGYREIVPAGVLYAPARDVLISSSVNLSDEKLAGERLKKLKRSGLILAEPEVLEAMEHGDEPRFIPVKFKNGEPSGESLVTAERLGLLSKHINKTLCDMAAELRRGSIAADPYYRGQRENACLNCDYLSACRFVNGENGEKLRYMPKLPATKVWNILEEGENDV